MIYQVARKEYVVGINDNRLVWVEVADKTGLTPREALNLAADVLRVVQQYFVLHIWG